MANMIENLGLEMFTKSDEAMNYLFGTVVSEGKGINGYYDSPYIRKTFNSAEITARLEPTENGYAVSGIDTHVAGNCVWEAVIQADITEEDSDRSERKVLVSTPKGNGLVSVNLINADVLPSFLVGDQIKAQVVGFPKFIEFYDDEDEFIEKQPEPAFGKKIVIAEDTIMATGFLRNHDPDDGSCKNNELDNINIFRGTIKDIYAGIVEIEDKKYETFYRLFIDTDFGKLELEINKDVVKDVLDSGKEGIKVGMTVLAGVVISGDVAIYEYGDGKIMDEEHDIRAIRQTICNKEPERIKSILTDECCYVSSVGKWDVSGRDAVVDVFTHVSKANDWTYKAILASLSEPLDSDYCKDLKYSPGKRCLVLENEVPEYESIMFIDCDENGYIERIEVTSDSRYRFITEQSAIRISEYDFSEDDPSPLEERLLLRAEFKEIIEKDEYALNEGMLSEESFDAAQKVMMSWSQEGLESDQDYTKSYKTLFGKAFSEGAGHPCDDRFIDAGSSFYYDFRLGKDTKRLRTADYRGEMITALQYVYVIGNIYAEKMLNNRANKI